MPKAGPPAHLQNPEPPQTSDLHVARTSRLDLIRTCGKDLNEPIMCGLVVFEDRVNVHRGSSCLDTVTAVSFVPRNAVPILKPASEHCRSCDCIRVNKLRLPALI
jgi:hypothetical protein